jgi:hypothetical protein
MNIASQNSDPLDEVCRIWANSLRGAPAIGDTSGSQAFCAGAFLHLFAYPEGNPSISRWRAGYATAKLSSMTTKKQEIAQRAVDLVGHVELAEQLNVPSWVVEAWMYGDIDMPDSKLMDLAAFLLDPRRSRVPI